MEKKDAKIIESAISDLLWGIGCIHTGHPNSILENYVKKVIQNLMELLELKT